MSDRSFYTLMAFTTLSILVFWASAGYIVIHFIDKYW